tara:strand:+ start:1974 stop:2228 length:255 start_codon:yes stop_codon:yes gene_type:complete
MTDTQFIDYLLKQRLLILEENKKLQARNDELEWNREMLKDIDGNKDYLEGLDDGRQEKCQDCQSILLANDKFVCIIRKLEASKQ